MASPRTAKAGRAENSAHNRHTASAPASVASSAREAGRLPTQGGGEVSRPPPERPWRDESFAAPRLRGHDPRARRLPRLRGDLEGADAAAHTAHVRYERDSRD